MKIAEYKHGSVTYREATVDEELRAELALALLPEEETATSPKEENKDLNARIAELEAMIAALTKMVSEGTK